MRRPLMIGLAASGISTLALLAYGLVASDRSADVPDPATLRDAFAGADSVALRLGGPSMPKPIGFFLKDRDSIEGLAALIVFEGRPGRSPDTKVSTDAIQARVVRVGRPTEVFTLVGGRALVYGPDGKYMARLKDDQFDRAVRALPGANPSTR